MVLLVFDVDGTLVYSDRRDSRCFADTYQTLYRRAFPSIDWSRYPHVTDDTIFRTVIQDHFAREVESEEKEVFQAHYIELLLRGRAEDPRAYREVAGARALIEYLQGQAGFQVAVATGGWTRPAHIKLNHVGIDTRDMPLIGADGKYTREEILQHAIDDSRVRWPEIEQIVYIGDAPWDVRTTRNMELNFVGVRYRNDLEVLQRLGAQHVIRDFADRNLFLGQIHAAQPPGAQPL